MNPEPLRQKLLAVARQFVPSDRVPPGFEKRVMHRLRSLSLPDPWSLWGAWLWRALAPCGALMLITLGGAVLMSLSHDSSDLQNDLSSVLIAGLDNFGDAP